MTDRETAWFAVHEALPARWQVGPVTFDPGVLRTDGLMGAFSVSARGPHPGRGKVPVTVRGTGADEASALRDLEATLRGAKPAPGSYLDALRQRVRLAFVSGAEDWTREKRRPAHDAGRVRRRVATIHRPLSAAPTAAE